MDADVAVVGAGIAGLSAAWRLALAGKDVVVLEQHAIGNLHGSSHGAVRIFRYAYPDPFYVSMAKAALPLWRELEQAAEDIVRITGGIDAGPDAFIEPIAAALESEGAHAERLSASERAARFPWLAAGDVPAVFSPDTGVIDAERALARSADAARSLGVRISEHTPVTSIDPETRVLETPAGPVRARSIVVAAGAWAAPLLAGLGIHVPLRVTREQIMYATGTMPPLPFIHYGEIHRYGVPPAGSAPGYKIGEHGTGRGAAPGEGEESIAEPEAARLVDYVRTALPGLDPEPLAWETCLYTSTASQDFALDVRDGIVVASACSGHGFKFGPLTGEIVACLVTGRTPPVEMSRFALTALS